MSKSSNSQYLYREVVVDPVILSTVYLGDAKYNLHETELVEEMKNLQEDLFAKLKEIIYNQLTERQREVMIKTYFEGRTQMEVADLLGVCQTTIHKIISGNIDYSNNGKRYGGALKKIRKICETDETVLDILARIAELKSQLSE